MSVYRDSDSESHHLLLPPPSPMLLPLPQSKPIDIPTTPRRLFFCEDIEANSQLLHQRHPLSTPLEFPPPDIVTADCNSKSAKVVDFINIISSRSSSSSSSSNNNFWTKRRFERRILLDDVIENESHHRHRYFDHQWSWSCSINNDLCSYFLKLSPTVKNSILNPNACEFLSIFFFLVL